jgi:hypothetical protein
VIRLYLLIFGSFITVIGALELIMPRRAFRLWQSWASNKFFFLHGILLIAAGFPLTVYQGPISTIIFFIGIAIVLTGPFVLLYPGKFRQMFQAVSEEFNDKSIKKILYVEGILRIAVGVTCAVTYFI